MQTATNLIMRQERQRAAAGKNQAETRESCGTDAKPTCGLRHSVSHTALPRGHARLQINPEVRALLRLRSGHRVAGQGPCRWTDQHAGVLPLTRAVQPPASSARSPRAQGSGRAIGQQPQTRLRSRSPGCAPRGAPRRRRAGSGGGGGSARGTHPQTAAGSTAARTAASCSPASARQTQRRCLPEQRAGRSRPRRRQGRGAVGTGAAPPAASLRGRTRQEGADALHEGVGLTRRVLLQRLRRHRQHGRTGTARPAPPGSARTGCLAATLSSTRRSPRCTITAPSVPAAPPAPLAPPLPALPWRSRRGLSECFGTVRTATSATAAPRPAPARPSPSSECREGRCGGGGGPA